MMMKALQILLAYLLHNESKKILFSKRHCLGITKRFRVFWNVELNFACNFGPLSVRVIANKSAE